MQFRFSDNGYPVFNPNLWKEIEEEKDWTNILVWSPKNSGSKISVFPTRLRICNNIFRYLWKCFASTKQFVSKKSGLNSELKKIKIQYMAKLLPLKIIWEAVSILAWKHQTIIDLWASFHPVFGHKKLIVIQVAKSKICVWSPPSTFIMFLKHMRHFELHPYIPEIHMAQIS